MFILWDKKHVTDGMTCASESSRNIRIVLLRKKVDEDKRVDRFEKMIEWE